MIPTKEELEKKWWHRLIQVGIWTITALISLLCIGFMRDSGNFENISFQLWLFITPFLTYGVLKVFYEKVVLYIFYGKEKKE